MQTDSLPILALAISIHFVTFGIILFVSNSAKFLVNQSVKNKEIAPQENMPFKLYTSVPSHETPRAAAGSSRVFNLKGFV